MRIDNGVEQLTVRNVNEHLNPIDLVIVDNKNVGVNDMNKSGVRLDD